MELNIGDYVLTRDHDEINLPLIYTYRKAKIIGFSRMYEGICKSKSNDIVDYYLEFNDGWKVMVTKSCILKKM